MKPWEGSACYPRSTFLSFERCPFHTETPDHYALVSYLLDLSVSQSSALCHYTLRTVTDRPEGTFRSLRYAFGGDHPSQTTHQAMSFKPKLELKQTKGRISTAAPQTLACLLQSLRPILHIACPNSMLSYSKGSRGLFVPSRVIGIFTDTTISLSLTVETASGSLHHSCRSELTRQGISLP